MFVCVNLYEFLSEMEIIGEQKWPKENEHFLSGG